MPLSPDFWSQLIATSGLQLLWKLNEASGAVAADTSGNARPGTIINVPIYSQPTLIPGVSDTCLRMNTAGSVKWIQRAHESWMNSTSFCYVCTVTFASFAAEKDVMGKQDLIMCWQLIGGKLRFYVRIAGTPQALDSVSTLALNTPYLVAIDYDGANQRIYINGVQDAIRAQTGVPNTGTSQLMCWNASVANRPPDGSAQGFAVYNRSLSSTEHANLYTRWLSGNRAPTTPGVFTLPLTGVEYDASINVGFGISTDADGDPIEYYGEYSNDSGGSWAMLFNWQSANAYNWNTSALAYKSTYKVRVKARDTTYLAESGWRESGVFGIRHISTPPNTPVLSLDNYTDFSVFISTNAFSDPDPLATHYATQWQLDLESGNFSAPKYDSGDDTVNLIERVITGLPQNTTLKVRARVLDQGGMQSAWSNVQHFTSRNLMVGGNYPWKARDRGSRAKHAIMGSVGVAISDFSNTFPAEIPLLIGGPGKDGLRNDLKDRGARLKSYNDQGLYDQTATNIRHCWRITGLGSIRVADFSFIAIINPDLAASAEICGSPGSWFMWHSAGGNVTLTADQTTGGNANFIGLAGLVAGVPNLVGYAHQEGVYSFNPVPSPCGTITTLKEQEHWIGVNGVWAGPQKGSAIVGPPPDNCPNGFEDLLWHAANDWLDIGHGSSNSQASADAWADGRYFKGIFSEFAFWPSHKLTEAEYLECYARALMPAGGSFEDYVKSIGDPLYFRFSEPEPPNKPRLEAV